VATAASCFLTVADEIGTGRDTSVDVRWHGRGGQGVVVLSQIAGYAAFLAGKEVQVFPEFGVERRGAPLRAFLRVASQPIRIRSAVERPHVIIVLDPMLLAQEETWSGTDEKTVVLFNTRGGKWTLPKKRDRVFAVDATAVALRNRLGTATTPIVNTAMAGAFARVTGLITMEHLARAIEKYSPSRPDDNVKAAREAFEETAPWE